MKISAVLRFFVFLAFMLQTAQSKSGSSSLCHSINSDDKCMNAPIKELITYRRMIDWVPEVGMWKWYHEALQGVLSEDASCGLIILEKSDFRGYCQYGKSRAMPWDELSRKVKRRFYVNGRESANNHYKRTPGGLLTAMGPEYSLSDDNCQDAVEKAWEFWEGSGRKRREVDNSNSTLDCSPTPWGDEDSNNEYSNNAEQYKISPFLFAIPAWSIVKVIFW